MKLISRLIIAGTAAVAILLAISNRDRIVVSLDPLPFEIEGPLYAILLITLIVGGCVGGVAGWVTSLKWRRIARRQRRQIASLEKQPQPAQPTVTGVPAPRTTPALPDDPGAGVKQDIPSP